MIANMHSRWEGLNRGHCRRYTTPIGTPVSELSPIMGFAREVVDPSQGGSKGHYHGPAITPCEEWVGARMRLEIESNRESTMPCVWSVLIQIIWNGFKSQACETKMDKIWASCSKVQQLVPQDQGSRNWISCQVLKLFYVYMI